MNLKEIYWIGETNEESLTKVKDEILQSFQKDPRTEITLFICSHGGILNVGAAFYDWIRLKGINLTTIGIGEVSSTALLILLAGKSERRKCSAHTIFVVHGAMRDYKKPPTLGFREIEELHRGTKTLNEILLKQILEKETKFSKKEISKIGREEIVLTAEQAKEKGIVSEIIAP